jgi:ATP-binding cassette subfamily F protein 3
MGSPGFVPPLRSSLYRGNTFLVMTVLIASQLRKEFSGDALFTGVSFSVGRRDRLSLAGPNGAGKTTLLRALASETSLQGGELAFAKGTRVALHDQRPPRDLGFTLREYALSGARDLLAAEDELRTLEQAMAAGTHDEATLRRYSEAQARLEHAGGWAWRDRVASAVRGLGFADPDLDRRLDTFSGGELTRASLARALAGDPDLLLLDEPTNHLDVESLEWLERELETLDAAVILVAHDRWFLEAVTTAVLELAPGGAHFFAGPWHEWRREKASRAHAAARTAERVSDDIARLERFVERFRYKKSKAKQAQAKLTQIGRLEKERASAVADHTALTRGRKTLGFDFIDPPRSGKVVLEAEGVTLSAGDKLLFENAEIAIDRGEKVALVGPNGSGKTTLLEALLGDRGLTRGTVRLGHGVVPKYFSQHTQELPKSGSVLDCAAASTGLPRPQAQTLLGRFLFSGWEMHERSVSALSGGERRRLALALLVASGANFLVLDEPTNHLDLESREALEAALEAFPGTVLVVSHDRALLDVVPDRIVAVEQHVLRSYDGGWADLQLARSSAPATEPPPKEKQARPQRIRPARKVPPSPLELTEARIAETEVRVAELERKLADDWTNMDVLAAHRAARDELQRLLTEWEELFAAAQLDR